MLIKKGEMRVRAPQHVSAREPPSGWNRAAAHVWARTVDIPFAQVPERFFPRLMRLENSGSANMESSRGENAGDGSLALDRLAFFDLETTGLSGGSGTIAFLATVAHFEGRDLILSQTFMEDYPGEPDFLEMVCAQLAAVDWVVSYNGASFDLPLLQSRCVVNRIPPPLVRQIDILRDCRRFWAHRATSCTLGSMEELLLSKRREEDIPSALVPRTWLDFVKAETLRDEQRARLLLVWRHNLEDVISLAEIFLLVESAYREPRSALVRLAIDPGGLAANLLRLGRKLEAKSALIWVRDCPQDFELSANVRMKALRRLASMARRERDRELYRQTVLSMDGDSIYGCIAKAKLYEHLEKDEGLALAWTLRARDILVGLDEGQEGVEPLKRAEWLEAIEHRRARLQKTLERRSGARP